MPRCEPGQLARAACFHSTPIPLLPCAYCFSRSMVSYSWRMMASRIWARSCPAWLPVGEEGLLGAGGALGAVQPLIATAQAGVAQGAVAAAVAGKLVEHVAHLGRLLVDVHLPGIAEVLAGQLRARQDRRQCAHLERGGGVVGRHIVGRVRPLRIAGCCDGEDSQTENPAALASNSSSKSPLPLS